MANVADLQGEIAAVFDLFKDIAEPHGVLNPRWGESARETEKPNTLTPHLNTTSPRDLRNAIRALGSERTAEDVRDMLEALGKDPDNGTLAAEEFARVMASDLANRDVTEIHTKAFQLIDEGATGAITIDDLRRVAVTMGERVEEATLNEMLMSADLDSDGMLNMEEFYRVMSKSKLK
mmetsp:Transcript_40358/g.126248  ORF Transcript_40358/g.126248 Transcript_40358/m.126248 type:complete len:178 (+) Transcript_40358:98-631(+)